MARSWSSIAKKWRALAVVVSMALVAVMLLAVPSSATFAKKFNLVMASTPSPITVGSSATVTATFTNKSLYSIGQVTLAVPSTKYSIDSASATPGTVVVAADKKSLSITGLSLKLDKPYTVTMTVSVACDAAAGSWGSTAKTSGGTSFTLNNAGNSQKTTVTGSCRNSISFVPGFEPKNTAAGGTMSEVRVQVTDFNNAPVATTVTLSGDIQNSGSVVQPTVSGIATFTGIKVTQAPKTGASLIATEGAPGGQTVSGTFDIVAASIAFDQQPPEATQFNEAIAPAPSVRVTDGPNGPGIEGVTVTMSIGTNPVGGTLGPVAALTSITDNTGLATFAGMNIGPDDTITSSGYTLRASIDGASVDSNPFAVANTIAGDCSPTCTATFPNGSTITAPGGTTLIIENNDPDFCSSISTVIAGTVTVIPSGTGDKLLTFVDPAGSAPSTEPFPQPGVTYPVCKGQDAGDPNPITLDYKFPEDRCINTGGPACIEDQYFQIGTLDLVTKVLISSADPTLKR